MAGHEWPNTSPSRPRRPGNQYQQIHIEGGRAQLGDTFIFGRESPLNLLPYAVEAPFNSYYRQHEPTCLPNTRVDLLQEIYHWADGQDERNIFWLHGLAGTGKSTIARTIARTYFDQRRLGASFFFSRGGGEVSHTGKFVTSLAVQLASNVPPLQSYISDAITERSDIASQSLRDQWDQLILRPLSKLDLDTGSCWSDRMLVIDALDECDSDMDIQIILQLLAEARLLRTARLRVFVTSRAETRIRYGFYQIPETSRREFVLHNISLAIVNHDISIFLEYSLRLLGQERGLGSSWPGEAVIQGLAGKASGLFIWAATACRFIREGRQFARQRLSTILEGSTSATTPEKHLNEIYLTVLKTVISPSYTEQEQQHMYRMLRTILGSIVVLSSPLSVPSLSRLLKVPKEDIYQTLNDLRAILDVPENQAHPLRLHHPSFRDFLLDQARCGDPHFWVDEKQAHQFLADNCIRLMSGTLKQDICSVGAPGFLLTNIKSCQVEQCLPLEVQYTCLYWAAHLQKSGSQLHDIYQMHQFLQKHLLHWLEALAWIGKVSEGIYAIAFLESITAACDCPRVTEFVYDMKRFVLYSRPAIELAPLQVYCSALIFTPVMSVVREQFEDCIPRWIQKLPEVLNSWNALVQTLEGHSHRVNAVAFSPDGGRLASASVDKTVRLWDAATGAALQTLKGHSGIVNTVAFLPDGQLASASSDHTVKLWEPGAGRLLQTLDHSQPVRAVALSRDGQLASASDNGMVKLWDANTGRLLKTLEGHLNYISALAFSPNGRLLAWASYDATVKLWDTNMGADLRTLKDHISDVNALAFSPDGKQLASASCDNTVKLWDADTGRLLQTLEHLHPVMAVAFSLNGQLASVSNDYIVKLWDAGSRAILQPLRVRSDSGSSDHKAIAFSPDGKQLALAPGDNTIKLLDPGSEVAIQTLGGHSDSHSGSVNIVAFSPDGKQLASASDDNTVKLWNTKSRTVLQTFRALFYSVGFYGVRAMAFSPDGKQLALALKHGTVELWDASAGQLVWRFKGHSHGVRAVAFSLNGKQLASASDDYTVKLWNTGAGRPLRTFKGHSGGVRAVAFSPDGKQLASASSDHTVKLWNAGAGRLLRTFKGHSHGVRAVAFSPDGKQLASASREKTIKLWEADSGVKLQTVEFDIVGRTLSFSDDGTFLQTNRGPLHATFLSDGAAVSGSNLPRSIFVTRRWVRWGMENMLWLPSEYRRESIAVYGSIIAFGLSSGQVTIMEFAF